MSRLLSSKAILLLLMASLISMLPASATSVTFTTGGVACAPAGLCSAVPGAQLITFDGLGAGTTSPYTDGIATYSFSGGSPFVIGSVASEYAAPPNDETTYLSGGSPGKSNPITISFSVPITYFGFYYGSPDEYNSIDFYQGASVVGSFNGLTLLPPDGGDQTVGEYMNFNVVNGSVDKIVLSSSLAAFETDNHAFVAAPEPASFALIGLGFLVLRGCTYRRRK